MTTQENFTEGQILRATKLARIEQIQATNRSLEMEREMKNSSNEEQPSSGVSTESPRPALESIRHPAADDDEIESYAHGVISGTMKSATPNVVGSLLARIRQMLRVEDERSRLRQEVQVLNRSIRNRGKCGTCGDPLSADCLKCQRAWES